VRQIVDDSEIEKINGEIKVLQSSIEGETDKKRVKAIKSDIKTLETQVKAIVKDNKAKLKKDNSNLKNVEDFIFKESRERMHDLLIVYQAMREAAVDCKVLQKFHSNSLDPVHSCF
jgi:ElaB/YqjD/DUF883 family membrane-anchored ribosome-binding protein